MIGERVSFSVTFMPQGWQFDAQSDRPLLLSAAASGITLPSSCRNGSCRTCISRLLSGQVQYRIEWPGLSIEEKRDGYVLPCVAYPQGDLTLKNRAARRG